jgi:polysaccharide biosynthesis/export protein
MQDYISVKPIDDVLKHKTHRPFWVKSLIILVLSGLMGCSSLPASGPSSSDISAQAGTNETARYELIELDSTTLSRLSRWPQESFHGRFGDYRAPQTPRIGVGDSLSVTIWEAGSGGLFTAPGGDRLSTGSKSVNIPEQVVGPDGQISIPYAGRIKVAGRTTLEVQNLIVSKLAGKAIEPQTLVTIPRPLSTSVTVTGEASSGGRIPLSVKGDSQCRRYS